METSYSTWTLKDYLCHSDFFYHTYFYNNKMLSGYNIFVNFLNLLSKTFFLTEIYSGFSWEIFFQNLFLFQPSAQIC